MKSKTTTTCGLDLQKDYFSLVQYSAEERAVTLVSIQPFSTEAPHDQWKTWESELKNNKGRLRFFNPSLICGLPAEYAIVKNLQLDADEKDVQDVIEWELSQQIIGSVDNYVFDYQETGSTGAVRKFLMIAYRQDLVTRLANIVRSAKLEPCAIDLDISGLINVFEANYPANRAMASLIVHAELESTRLVLTQNGTFLDFHTFEHKTGSMNAEGFVSALVAEIEHFCAVSEKINDKIGVYATGSYFQHAVVRSAFFEKVAGAELLNPFREIKCEVAIEEKQLEEYSTQLAVAVGLSLQGVE